MHKTMRVFGCGAIAVLALLVASSAGAQDNHFRVWDVSDTDVDPDIPVTLVDQFRPVHGWDATVEYLDYLANPAVKDGTYPDDLVDPNEHQTWYKLQDFPLLHYHRGVEVTFSNQFGLQKWIVRGTNNPQYLVVPASKDGSPGPGSCMAPPLSVGNPCAEHSDCDNPPGAGNGVCGGLQHYLCYVATGPPYAPPPSYTVQDQFSGPDPIMVLGPGYWCNPVEKIVLPVIREPAVGGNGTADTTAAGDDIQVVPFGSSVAPGQTIIHAGDNRVLDTVPGGDDVVYAPPVYPINPLREHQACYVMFPQDDSTEVVNTDDQLAESTGVAVQRSQFLCVPSEKLATRVPTMGHWGFVTLVGVLMLTTVAYVAYRRRAVAPGSAD